MSRIWDSLKQIELTDVVWASRAQPRARPFSDRRCCERAPDRLSIFVYGHTIVGEPFYEASEALGTNSQGALIKLQHLVTTGQNLLLTNTSTEEEEQCRVVGVRSVSEEKIAVAVAFHAARPHFWNQRRE